MIIKKSFDSKSAFFKCKIINFSFSFKFKITFDFKNTYFIIIYCVKNVFDSKNAKKNRAFVKVFSSSSHLRTCLNGQGEVNDDYKSRIYLKGELWRLN